MMRRTPLRPMSKKRAKEMRRNALVREAVFQRDGYRCQAPAGFAGSCFGPLTFHHLLKASQGGDYTVTNGLTLCAHHNGAVEDHPAEAHALGLVVRRSA